MNASYAWLRALVPTTRTPRELAELLTSRTATVEALHALRADLEPIVVARVVEAARHPASDHLSVTKVDAGNGSLVDVVCGAPNVRAGALYPFAAVGTTMPNGLRIEKRKIRGAVSQGMLCSARELGLGDDHEGILELEIDAVPGTPLLQALPLGDTILEVDVLPNRPDLLSHLGIAREIAAAEGVAFALPDIPGSDGVAPTLIKHAREATAGGTRVVLDDVAGCPRYCGVRIDGVTIGPSPEWLAERIRAMGGRPINNVVDATNYLLHELGQPMHAFDAAALGGSAIVIRKARDGERLTTLDGVTRTLQPWMTVIADGDRAQAVAGVMGGGDSEVTDRTTDIFLEVAHFDPANTRRMRRALGMSTDASYLFERGTDPALPPVALARAATLIRAVAGGAVQGSAVDLFPEDIVERSLGLRPARVAHVLGEPIAPDEIQRHLESIGFVVTPGPDSHVPMSDRPLRVRIPSWRRDVDREIDLIEEVARLHGYDAFSDELRPYRETTVPFDAIETAANRVREALVAEGLLEARPMPFVAGDDATHVRVANPLAENEAHLRTSLLETLARRTEHNLAGMQRTVRLFEVGAAFARTERALPYEEMRAAAVILGDRTPSHWRDGPPPHADEWDAKWLAEVMARSAHPGAEVALVPAPAADGTLWQVLIDGAPRGDVRRLALDAPPWAPAAYGAEVAIAPVSSRPVAEPGTGSPERGLRADGVSARERKPVQYVSLPSTPASGFDVALIVPDALSVVRVEEVMRRSVGPLLERLQLLSEFRGGNVPQGHRSVAWSLTLRHPERTLESREVAGRRDKMLRTLEGELGIEPRTS
jgi:phenylalanyl-tRNA synthetase beta chain